MNNETERKGNKKMENWRYQRKERKKHGEKKRKTKNNCLFFDKFKVRSKTTGSGEKKLLSKIL